MKSQVFSGARAFLKINGTIVGYMLAVSGTTGINYAPIEACGSFAVIEHVPIGYTVEMTAQLSRLAQFTRLAQATGVQVSDGSAQAVEGDMPQIMPAHGTDGLAILESGELTAVIQDRVTNTSVYTIAGVKASQKAFDIGGRAPVAENLNFVARLIEEDGESSEPLSDSGTV